MVTLSDFQKLESLEHDIKQFIFQKCREYDEAKAFDVDDYYKDDYLEDDFDWYELEGTFLKVYFMESRTYHGEDEQYSYSLPLDILFGVDFKDKMKARFEEEREKQRLALIEKRKRYEVELRALAEEKKKEEIEQLKELLKKYPDVAINHEGV